MTTIAYRDGVIAADTQLTKGDRFAGTVKKIARSPDGAIGGACGDWLPCSQFLDWIEKGGPDQVPGSGTPTYPPATDEESRQDGILVKRDGSAWLWSGGHTLARFAMTEGQPYFALGTGALGALTAMFRGATAQEAIEAVGHFDIYTGGGITTLALAEASSPPSLSRKAS